MHVLSVIHYPTFGGPHNRNLRLWPVLKERGVRLTVLLPEENGNAVSRFERSGAPHLTTKLHRVRAKLNPFLAGRIAAEFLPDIARLRKVIRDYAIDLVLINGLVNPHAAIAARLEHVPVVWQILDTRPPFIVRKAIMSLVVRLSDAIMCTGRRVAEMHPGSLDFTDRLVLFYPPVDTAHFQVTPEKRAAARRELGIPDAGVLIGSVANINPQKGHEYLIRAAAMLQDRVENLYVRILGESTPTHLDYEVRLRQEAGTLGLLQGDRLRFIAPGNRVGDLLAAFDLFLLASVPRSEGIPTVILEAMAAGLPVVATDVGSISEVVENGQTGFVVPPENPAALAVAAARILTDPELSHRMSQRASETARRKYDLSACANTHLKAFSLAMDHHGPARRRTG